MNLQNQDLMVEKNKTKTAFVVQEEFIPKMGKSIASKKITGITLNSTECELLFDNLRYSWIALHSHNDAKIRKAAIDSMIATLNMLRLNQLLAKESHV